MICAGQHKLIPFWKFRRVNDFDFYTQCSFAITIRVLYPRDVWSQKSILPFAAVPARGHSGLPLLSCRKDAHTTPRVVASIIREALPGYLEKLLEQGLRVVPCAHSRSSIYSPTCRRMIRLRRLSCAGHSRSSPDTWAVTVFRMRFSPIPASFAWPGR